MLSFCRFLGSTTDSSFSSCLSDSVADQRVVVPLISPRAKTCELSELSELSLLPVSRIKMRKSEISEISRLFMCRLGDSLPIGTLCVRVIWPGMPQAGVRWCGVFQVVKTAQSRGRTERTLFKALSQLRGPMKVARCGFPENHEKASRFPDFLQRSTGREQ